MAIEPGQNLLHYRVVEKIGEGGMGVVWKATDTSLQREVAIKVLPDTVAADPERLARFEREAKLLAALNHPNIAAVYGLHRAHPSAGSQGVHFIAMELVSGEDLSQRLARGALPVDDALEIALQISAALEGAHDSGVIHRDLKPANVVVRSDGAIKVLDFGLAKAFEPDAASSETSASLSPTVTSAGTIAGIILGTAAYMSPEQAHGRAVDRRADLWALGCMLLEMLTGKQVFHGESISDTIAAVLRTQPDWSALPPKTPRALRRLLERCLEKDPRQRLHHAADARLEIEAAREALKSGEADASPVEVAKAAPWWRIAAPALAVGALLGALLTAGFLRREAPEAIAPAAARGHFAIDIPDYEPLDLLQNPPFVISPDGNWLVYTVRPPGDPQSGGLYRRAIDSFDAEPIAGTEGGFGPFFSPDGEWVGYFDLDENAMRKIPLRGGSAVDLAPVDTLPRGATWSEDGYIVFSPNYFSGLWRVADTGGEPERLTEADPGAGIKSHRYPQLLPDGSGVLFTIGDSTIESFDDATLAVYSFETGEIRELLRGGCYGSYLPSGYLLYARDGEMLAAPFDISRHEITGNPITVLENVITGPSLGIAPLAFSRTGTLVYMPGGPDVFFSRPVWIDRSGKTSPLPIEPRMFSHARFSSDGRQLVLRTDGANGHLWGYDIEREALTRLTTEWDNDVPVTGPDMKLVYLLSKGESQSLVLRSMHGLSEPEVLRQGAGLAGSSISPDGKWLAYVEFGEATGADLWLLSLEGDRRPLELLTTRYDEFDPVFSPDGRWLVYGSNESGRTEVYLTRVDEPRAKWQVSTKGGINAIWGPAGREIFYRNDRWMMAVDIGLSSPPKIGKPRFLFEYNEARQGQARAYDVAPDGQRFVSVVRTEAGPPRLHVVLNWFEELAAVLE